MMLQTYSKEYVDKLLAVVEAAQLMSDHIHVPASGEHLARPDHHRALMEALTAVQTKQEMT